MKAGVVGRNKKLKKDSQRAKGEISERFKMKKPVGVNPKKVS